MGFTGGVGGFVAAGEGVCGFVGSGCGGCSDSGAFVF